MPAADEPDATSSVLVARQPIYDRAMRVFAYEVLFRNPDGSALIQSGDDATSQVMVNTLMDIGLNRIVGESLAFINLTEGYITGELPLPPLGGRIVLEVLETVRPTPAVVEGLTQLAAQDYLIALDDFIHSPSFDPLLGVAHIVKLDVMALSDDELAEHVARLAPFNVRLLAEKVETHDQFRRCEALGFELFQGYFFCKPDLVRGQRPMSNRLTVTQLLGALQRADIEIGELQTIIARDATLAYRLLNYVNSAYFNFRSDISSIRHALTLVGMRGIRQWASLILMMSLSAGKPSELLVLGMTRANMCEALAVHWPAVSADLFFTTGLFSILDALMDKPMNEVIASVAVDQDVANALIRGDGAVGKALKMVISYEQGDTAALSPEWQERCQRAYLDALDWSRNVTSASGSVDA